MSAWGDGNEPWFEAPVGRAGFKAGHSKRVDAVGNSRAQHHRRHIRACQFDRVELHSSIEHPQALSVVDDSVLSLTAAYFLFYLRY